MAFSLCVNLNCMHNAICKFAKLCLKYDLLVCFNISFQLISVNIGVAYALPFARCTILNILFMFVCVSVYFIINSCWQQPQSITSMLKAFTKNPRVLRVLWNYKVLLGTVREMEKVR